MAATDVKNDATLSTSLVHYYELGEAAGASDRVDSHGSLDLTAFNTPGQAVGVQGNAVDFDATATEYLKNTTGTGLSTDFSVNFWVNLDVLDANYHSFVNTSSGVEGWSIRLDATTDKIFCSFADTAETKYRTDSAYFVSGDVGNWVMVTMVVDISVPSITMYKNASAVAGSTFQTSSTTLSDTLDLWVGSFDASLYHVDGQMDELGIWSKQLSGAEITDLYASGVGIPYDAGGAAANNNSARRMHMMMM